MDNTTKRRYPVGIQTFERIRKENYIYIDKTDLMWRMTKKSPFVFLSRPRRFGKTLLTTTLDAYFKGQKELFEGLKIMQLEKEWESYPVLHFDLSLCKNKENVEQVKRELLRQLSEHERGYRVEPKEDTPGARFTELIRLVYEKAGKQVVVIIDEYDAPLLDVLHEDERLPEYRRVMQEFYQPLKANEAMIRFCFITGITKFSQLSIFSTLNNLRNISLNPEYSAICGITKEEMLSTFSDEIDMLATRYKTSREDMIGRLSLQYDGYHFTSESPDIFNPFSLLGAFDERRIGSYWFSTGTPTFLYEQMRRFGTDIMKLSRMEVTATQFDVPTEGMVSALPLLYQSGYLTIKGYDIDTDKYTLDFPNAEVKVGFMEGFLGFNRVRFGEVEARGFAGDFYASLLRHDTDGAMRHLQAFFAGIPYMEHGGGELADIARFEAYYQVLMYVVFSVFNSRTYTEVRSSRGRADVVVFMNDATYVMEIKVNGTAEQALRQIDDKGYAIPYGDTGKPVVKIGVAFSQETRTVSDWKIVEC